MIKILFVCVENSNRSQMAQAFAKIHGKEKVEAYSAGSNPSGKINPKAILAMEEIGYDLTTHHSKSLGNIPSITWDYLIGMGCGDKCPSVQTKNRIEWDIADPKNMEKAEFKKVRDLIEQRVLGLLDHCGINSDNKPVRRP